MRILHILDHSIPLQSGYAFRTQAILECQREMGWETFHLTSPKHVLKACQKEMVEGWEFYRTTCANELLMHLPVIRELSLMAATRARINSVVREILPDIIHAHSPVLNAFPALSVGAHHNIPVVYELRALWEDAAVSHGTSKKGGLRYRLSKALESRALKRADAITTICDGLCGDIVSRGTPPEKVTVIPNAVNPSEFAASATRDDDLAATLGLADKFVLGFVGSFYAYEGLNLLLQTLPALRQSNPDIRVLLVGGGPEETHLKTLAAELGIADDVVFCGRVPHGEVGRYYGLIDILVYPRIPNRLTNLVTPLKPLEAMAQSKIVVASDVGGHKELIRDGETGFLFVAGSVRHLASTIIRVMGQRQSWPTQTARARRYVETERSWAKSVVRYQQVYATVLQAKLHSASSQVMGDTHH